MSTKSHQVNDKAKTTRVQVRHKLYTIKLQPGAQLHPIFKSRLFDIAANLQNNNSEYASYLAELIVRDYGTHFVTHLCQSDIDGYRWNRTSSKVFTIGGPPFQPNFTVTDWENGVPDALVAIDH